MVHKGATSEHVTDTVFDAFPVGTGRPRATARNYRDRSLLHHRPIDRTSIRLCKLRGSTVSGQKAEGASVHVIGERLGPSSTAMCFHVLIICVIANTCRWKIKQCAFVFRN